MTNTSGTGFFLPFEVSKAPFNISIRDKMILLGSCFAENIGQKLSENKFKVLVNPTGVIYNPFSVFKLIRDAADGSIDADRIIEREGIFYHLDAHSDIWAESKEGLVDRLKHQLAISRSWLSNAPTLIFSLGTSYIYLHKKTQSIVANCHKIPGKEFSKRLLTVKEIYQHYFEAMDLVRAINPDIRIILTVSPVRHIRDGLIENNLSKSILIQAIQKILEQDKEALYFPSYEMVIDVLRDYRFYQKDMIHPNDQAIEYIWENFANTYLEQETIAFLDEWSKIRRALNHKPFHPNSAAHQRFLKDLHNKLVTLKDIIEVESELKTIDQQMKSS